MPILHESDDEGRNVGETDHRDPAGRPCAQSAAVCHQVKEADK
jgi:hypothetical protein